MPIALSVPRVGSCWIVLLTTIKEAITNIISVSQRLTIGGTLRFAAHRS